MMPFRRTCREAAALLVAREDRPLGTGDRIALRLHLLACAACPRFERQMLTMRNSMQQWRHYAEEEQDSATNPVEK
nr:zf-HC2 domain-containing protein [uncultured Rhodoferax sp.]